MRYLLTVLVVMVGGCTKDPAGGGFSDLARPGDLARPAVDKPTLDGDNEHCSWLCYQRALAEQMRRTEGTLSSTHLAHYNVDATECSSHCTHASDRLGCRSIERKRVACVEAFQERAETRGLVANCNLLAFGVTEHCCDVGVIQKSACKVLLEDFSVFATMPADRRAVLLSQ